MIIDLVLVFVCLLMVVVVLFWVTELFGEMRKSLRRHHGFQWCACGRYRLGGNVQISVDDDSIRHAQGLCQPLRETIANQ